MSLYEYKCEKCGYVEEVIRKYEQRDEPLTCAKCLGESKRVEVSASNFHLKGGGWHDPHGGVR